MLKSQEQIFGKIKDPPLFSKADPKTSGKIAKAEREKRNTLLHNLREPHSPKVASGEWFVTDFFTAPALRLRTVFFDLLLFFAFWRRQRAKKTTSVAPPQWRRTPEEQTLRKSTRQLYNNIAFALFEWAAPPPAE